MKRDLVTLAQNHYDIAIIGGGIYGASMAWEAALRGLSVALVEKSDFGAGASANSLKTIHGGLRYLQSADVGRMRASVFERSTLLQIAPHLVHVLPVLVPTYGHIPGGRAALSLAVRLNNLLTYDRNRAYDPLKHIPDARLISKRETLALAPGIDDRGLTGGLVFFNAQAHNTERLTLAFIQSAVNAGAEVANYAEVVGLLRAGDAISGIVVCDRVDGATFEIRAKTVINTAGAWIPFVQGLLHGQPPPFKVTKALNLVVRRQLFEDNVVAVSGEKWRYFVSPGRGRSLIGTEYLPYDGDLSSLAVSPNEIDSFLAALNRAIPLGRLTRDDVSFVHRGLLPIKRANAQAGTFTLSKHPRIIDHAVEGAPGLFSVEGVQLTTARSVAQTTLDRVFKSWGRQLVPSVSASTPLHGGELERGDDFVQAELKRDGIGVSVDNVRRLIRTYGSEYRRVLTFMGDTRLKESLALLRAEIIHAVRLEMALKLTDVILRRTDVGTAEPPSEEILSFCANLMRHELGWSEARTRSEVESVRAAYVWDG